MSFPLSQFNPGTLCGNMAVSLQTLSPQERPSLQEIFTRVDRLYQLCNIYPGSVTEIGLCAQLLKKKSSSNDEDQKCQKALIGHSLASQIANRESTKSESSALPNDLCRALRAKSHSLPPFADLSENILKLVDLSRLKISNFSPLQFCLVDLYPVEERKEKDHRAFNELRLLTCSHFVSLAPKLEELQFSYEKSEKWRKEVLHVRASGHLSAQKFVERIFQIDKYSTAKEVDRLEILQTLLNGLLAEERALAQLQDLRTQSQNFYPKDRPDQDFKERAKARDFNLGASVAAFISAQKPQYRKLLIDYFQNNHSQVEKAEALSAMNKISTVSQKEDRLQRSLYKVGKLRSKVLTSPPLNDIPPNIWEDFTEKIVYLIDYRIFLWRALHHIYRLAGHCRDIFETNTLDGELAKAALPALYLVHRNYTANLHEVLESGHKQYWEYGTDIDQIAELICATSAQRNEIYILLYNQLRKSTPQAGPTRRRALKCAAILIDDKDRGLLLPNELFSQKETPSLTPDHLPASDQLSQAPAASRTDRQPIHFEPKSPLAIWAQLKIGLDSWQSPFAYHPRVNRWFGAHPPLNTGDFPEYGQRSLSYQQLMIHLHRLVPLADFFCQRGWQESSLSDRGELIKRFILPAELELDQKSLKGLIVWAVDVRNICYHRFFHKELKSVKITQALYESYEQTQTIPDIERSASLGNLEFSDCKSASAEIDQLCGTATLKDEKIPNLVLRLKFIGKDHEL